jgi:hypothetical protein
LTIRRDHSLTPTDESLTIYIQAPPPPEAKCSYWPPARRGGGNFALHLRLLASADNHRRLVDTALNATDRDGVATSTSAIGAERKCRHGSLPAAIGGNPENICSSRALLRLTRSGPWEAVTGMPESDGISTELAGRIKKVSD